MVELKNHSTNSIINDLGESFQNKKINYKLAFDIATFLFSIILCILLSTYFAINIIQLNKVLK